MPVIDGKVVRARYTKLKLNELSSVDNPAQPGALAVIMKRDDSHERADPMSKTIEQVEGELAKALETIETLKAEVTKGKADFAAMLEDKDKADEECKTAKAALVAATDEVIKVDDTEVRKSEVGVASFNLTKALISKAETAEFENVAKSDFPNLVGTVSEKALVLKAIATMPEEAKKAAEAILTSAEKMLSAGFTRLGVGHGDLVNPSQKVAEGTFMQKVAEVEKRDGIAKSAALAKARMEFPAEFAAYAGN
jgi:hypothetical protein